MPPRVSWIIALLGIAALASADTITLTDGRVFEGRLERDKGDLVRIVTAGETLRVPEGRVRSVESPPPLDAYRARQRETSDTPPARMALSRWCAEQGMDSEARQQALAALALDPEFAEAREALGYRKVAGVWMSPADEKALASSDAPAQPRDEVEEGRAVGLTDDRQSLIVEARRKGLINTDTRFVRVGIPLVTLELRPTLGQLMALRTVFTSGAITTGGGAQQNIFIEAPVTQLTAVRTTAQVAAYP